MRFPLLLLACAAIAIVFQSVRTRDGRAVDPNWKPLPARSAGDPARRILPGSAAAADWLGALLNDPDRVVALPEQVATWSSLRLAPEVWGDHPRFERFDSEHVMAFKPDLVLVSPFTDAAMVARVEAAGFPVMTVAEPTSWEKLLSVGSVLSERIGRETAGVALIASLEARRARLAGRPAMRTLRVLPYMNSGGGGYTSGADTTLNLALELAGYENAAARLGIKGSSNIASELVLGAEFDAILVSGRDGVSQGQLAMQADDVLRTIPAVSEGRFIVLDTALFASGSQVILDAAEEIARQGDALR